MLAGGISAFGWASPAWRALSGALRPAAELLPGGVRALVPSGGWRIYTVSDSMPTFDPGDSSPGLAPVKDDVGDWGPKASGAPPLALGAAGLDGPQRA